MDQSATAIADDRILRDLRALEAIERDPRVSQRQLARDMDVALGVANACVHALVRKGLVKIRGSNNRTLTYHLTKRGLVHKTALTAQWTANTIDWYVQARRQVAEQLETIRARGVALVLFYGANEVTELASIVALQIGLRVAGVVAPAREPRWESVIGTPVQDVGQVTRIAFDAVITCADLTREELAALRTSVGAKPVFTVSGKEL